MYKQLLTNRLHGKATELCLKSQCNNYKIHQVHLTSLPEAVYGLSTLRSTHSLVNFVPFQWNKEEERRPMMVKR